MARKILTALLAAAALTGCASLPREQLAYEAAYQALHVVDTLQTLDIKDSPGRYERNPILGRHPSDAAIVAYMAAEAVGHAYISSLLADRSPLWVQRAWHYASIGWSGVLVISNHKRGLTP